MTAPTICPFLMFQGDGMAALDFYATAFPNARIDLLELYGPGEPGVEGTIRRARLAIGNQSVLCTDSVVKHDFGFTPAFSFLVDCADETQLRMLASRLATGGFELMPVGTYGFSALFGWVQDRFGVSWQLNLA